VRRALAAALLVVGGCGAGSGHREFDGHTALRYVARQVAFGPRIPNTPAHLAAGDWIDSLLRARADTVVVQAFTHVAVEGDTLALRNFLARFRPDDGERVLYVAHWDTRPQADRSPNLDDRRRPVPGANDGASGVALLLGVADALHRRPPSVGVDLLFVDGEDYGDFALNRDVLLGSRHYAATLGAERPLFAVVWDMIGDRDLEIYREGHSLSGAPEVVDRVWRTARQLGHGGTFRDEELYTVTDDHLPLLEVGIRAIDVIDLDYAPWHTTEDTLDRVSAESLRIVGEVALALVR
jgi:hypothetical protein